MAPTSATGLPASGAYATDVWSVFQSEAHPSYLPAYLWPGFPPQNSPEDWGALHKASMSNSTCTVCLSEENYASELPAAKLMAREAL